MPVFSRVLAGAGPVVLLTGLALGGWGPLLLARPAWAACPPVHRSQALVRHFKRTHVCPSTGTVTSTCHDIVDHIIPLCLGPEAGGLDVLENLQYQSVAEAKAKDKIERQMCRVKPRPCPHQGD